MSIHAMALRSVSFVDLDWAAEEAKLRVRVNRRTEKKKHRRNKQIIEQQKRKTIMSTPEQVQVKTFLSHIAATTTDDVALRAFYAMAS